MYYNFCYRKDGRFLLRRFGDVCGTYLLAGLGGIHGVDRWVFDGGVGAVVKVDGDGEGVEWEEVDGIRGDG